MTEESQQDTGSALPAAPEVGHELQALIQVGQQFIALQGQEIELKKMQVEANKEIAIASIQAEKEAAAHDRTHEGGQEVRKYVFATIITILAVGTIITLVMIGAKEMVADILKIILGFAAGAFGGVYYGKNKAAEAADE